MNFLDRILSKLFAPEERVAQVIPLPEPSNVRLLSPAEVVELELARRRHPAGTKWDGDGVA